MTIRPNNAPAAAANPPEMPLLAQVSLAHLVSHLHIMTIPALLPLLPAHFGTTFVGIGFALTVFNLVSLLVQTPMGFISDRFGARRVLIAGLLLGGASFMLLAFTQSYGALIVAMAGAGIANGVYHPADYALLANGIDGKRMGRAFSIHTFAGYLGTAMAPVLLLGTAAYLGLSQAFAVSGLLAFAVALLLILAPAAGTLARKRAATTAEDGSPEPRRRGLVTGTVVSLTIMFALLNLSTGGIQSFSVSALVAGYGIDLPSANAALTAFLFASAAGVLAGGALADRTARHGLVAAGAFLVTAAISLALALASPSALMALLLLGLAGFLSGIITPSRDMMVRAAAPAGAEGIVFGMVTTGFNIGGLAGPMLYAALLDNGANRMIFAVAACFMVATVVLALVQERRARGNA